MKKNFMPKGNNVRLTFEPRELVCKLRKLGRAGK